MNRISRKRHWLKLLPLLGLLGTTYWLIQQMPTTTSESNNANRHTPDAIIENFSSIKLNEKGSSRLVVSAQKMLHYPDTDSSELEMPNIVSIANQNSQIRLSAKKGIINDTGDDIYLSGHVKVRRDTTPQQSGLTLETEYLQLTPKQHIARSDQAVTLRTQDSVVRAVGFELNSRTRTLKLLSQVKTEYAPQNN